MADLDATQAYDSNGNGFMIPSPMMGNGGSSPWPYMSIGIASRVGGAVSQAFAASAQGAYKAAQEKTNAQLAEISAQTALIKGGWQASQIEKGANQRAAKTLASSGSQGVTAGSMVPVAAQEQEFGAIDALQAKANAYQEAFGYKTEAIQNENAAKLTKLAADNTAGQTLITGGLQAIGGAAQDYMYYDRYANGMGRMGASMGMGRG